jgi:hypothetical protein
MKIAVFALVVLLSGCATQQLNTGLQELMGHNIRVAIDHLGYPDGQRTVMGHTVYVWSTSGSMMLPMTTTSTTTGMVGSTPVYGTTNQTNFMPMGFSCTVQIATDSDGTMKSYQWAGNQPGCRRYARGFR